MRRGERQRGYVKWWLIVSGLAMIAVGSTFEYVIPDSYKFLRDLLVTVLPAAGFGAIIGEVIARGERKAHEAETRQLLDPARARARAAYRIPGHFAATRKSGDVQPKFQWTIDDKAPSRWRTPLSLSFAALGIDAVVDPLLARDDLGANTKFLYVEQAVVSAGEYAGAFYDLATRMEFLLDEATRPTLPAELARHTDGIHDRLREVSGYFDHCDVDLAWRNFTSSWIRGSIDDGEAGVLLTAFHAYLLLLGLDHRGFTQWEDIVQRLARLRRFPAALLPKATRRSMEGILRDAQRGLSYRVTLGRD